MLSDVAIDVQNLSKKYRIGAEKSDSIREYLMGVFGGLSKDKLATEFWALNDLSVQIKRGDAVGIIGKNGAGKSTLLKVLSRITEPTKGKITINGRVSSLLEVGTGFHPELTGKENIFLNGTILGMSRNEVKNKFDEIVEFSGVEKFLNTAVKHYSSGMYVRLAFAVAAHLEPEILIIDEVLAVGDADFQKKCLGKMKDVAGQGRTVIFVSHSMDAVSNLCNSAILLEKGQIHAASYEVNDIISSYLNSNIDENEKNSLLQKQVNVKNEIHSIDSLALVNSNSIPHKKNIQFDQPLIFQIVGQIFKEDPSLNIGAVLYNYRNEILSWNWINDGKRKNNPALEKVGKFNFSCQLPINTLNHGEYRLEVVSVLHNLKSLINKGEGPSIVFQVEGGNKGIQVNLPMTWELK